MDIQSTTSVAAENTVAKIIKSIKVQRAETAAASSGKERVQYVSAAPPAVCSVTADGFTTRAFALRPPRALTLRVAPSPRRSVCLPGRAFSHRPLPRELSPSLMSKCGKQRRRWNPSGGALYISNGMICTRGAEASSGRVVVCCCLYIYT